MSSRSPQHEPRGRRFDVESESELSLTARGYERFAEVRYCASECLSDWSRRGEDDCNLS